MGKSTQPARKTQAHRGTGSKPSPKRLSPAQVAQSDVDLERDRRDHAWRVLLVDKLLIALVVGVALIFSSHYWNVSLENRKSDALARLAQVQLMRAASDEAWSKVITLQESVFALESIVRSLKFHREATSPEEAMGPDKRKFEKKDDEVKLHLIELWRQLQSQQPRFGSEIHARFVRITQDLAAMRLVYVDQFAVAGLISTDSKDVDDTATALQNDLNAQETRLLETLEHLR